MWYAFEAYNNEARFGWTENPAVAELACSYLNRNREINLYSIVPLSDRDDETGARGPGDHNTVPLAMRGDLLFGDDTTLDDIREWFEE